MPESPRNKRDLRAEIEAMSRTTIYRRFKINHKLWTQFEAVCDYNHVDPDVAIIHMILKKCHLSRVNRDITGRKMRWPEARAVKYRKPHVMIDGAAPLKRERVVRLYKGVPIPDNVSREEMAESLRILNDLGLK